MWSPGCAAGADWDVTFLPFSLGQAHVEEGEPPVWERPDDGHRPARPAGVVAVRDTQPDAFLDAHHALFEHRHAAGRPDLRTATI